MKTCVAGGWIASLNHVIVQTAFLEGWSTTFLCRGFSISVKTESGEHLTFKARQSWNKGWGNCDKTDFWTPCFLLLQSLPYRSCSLGSAPSIEWPCRLGSSEPASSWEVISASHSGWFKWKVLHYQAMSRAASPEPLQVSWSCGLLPIRPISNQTLHF